jgi:small subunit ribosomal protein S5
MADVTEAGPPQDIVNPTENAPAPASSGDDRGPARGARGGGGRGGPGGNRGGSPGGNRGGGPGGNRGRRDGQRGGSREEGGEELIEKLVHINRVSKTVKGGKRFGFAALVVVGDGKGRVGFGKGKAREVPEAITKGTAAAKRAMVRVPLREGRTLHHDGMGHLARAACTSAPRPRARASSPAVRCARIFESLGVADVVTKSTGTSNPYNMIRATFEALASRRARRRCAAPRQEDR